MAIPNSPISRSEQYLNAIATGETGGIPNVPLTRTEQYFNKITTGSGDTPEQPLTRMEQYLDYIAENGSGGGGGVCAGNLTGGDTNGNYESWFPERGERQSVSVHGSEH